MNLDECRRKGFITPTIPNRPKAASLLEVAQIKEETIKDVTLTERSINAYMPLAYDSLRETLEAWCLLHGHHITNHVCLGALLKQEMPDFDDVLFDRFRYVRNGINYYGKQIGLEEGIELIKKIFSMRKEMQRRVKSKLA